MPLANLLVRPCVIVRRWPTSIDEYGEEVFAEHNVETVCELQQLQRTEAASTQGELSMTVWRLFLPIGTVIRTADTVIVNDIHYEVAGDPWIVDTGPTTSMHHVEATLTRQSSTEEPDSAS